MPVGLTPNQSARYFHARTARFEDCADGVLCCRGSPRRCNWKVNGQFCSQRNASF
jgi:hypothetical protein